MGLKHAYQATGVDDPAKQVSVNRWNADHEIDGPIDLPIEAIDPSAPPDGFIRLSSKSMGGRAVLMQTGPSGIDTSLQPNLGGNKVALWMPPGGATTAPGVFGMAALSGVGTATSRAVTVTNVLTRMTRLGYVSAAAAASVAGGREAVAKFTVGAGGGLGGFFARYRFGVSDALAVAGARMFIGLSASTAAPTNVEPSALVNSVGVVQLSSAANLQMYCSGASAGQNLVDLGPNFPVSPGSVDAYELTLFAPANGGFVGWRVSRLNTAFSESGVFTTGLPAGTQLLCHQIWRGNNATTLAVGLDICGIYMETDY